MAIHIPDERKNKSFTFTEILVCFTIYLCSHKKKLFVLFSSYIEKDQERTAVPCNARHTQKPGSGEGDTTNLDKSPHMRHKETFCGIAMTQYNIQFNKKLIV